MGPRVRHRPRYRSERGPRDAATAVDALRIFLARVNAFNAAHDPSEAIYVLVSLTDYYPPGVPGDRFAYDHPTFDLTPILPAPWYRAGVREFDFDQEHDQGVSSRMPNYEVYYKPWVRHVVASLSDNRVILGWQLGNELKARGSPRNGISSAQAYGWYLDFTRDMVDTSGRWTAITWFSWALNTSLNLSTGSIDLKMNWTLTASQSITASFSACWRIAASTVGTCGV